MTDLDEFVKSVQKQISEQIVPNYDQILPVMFCLENDELVMVALVGVVGTESLLAVVRDIAIERNPDAFALVFEAWATTPKALDMQRRRSSPHDNPADVPPDDRWSTANIIYAKRGEKLRVSAAKIRIINGRRLTEQFDLTSELRQVDRNTGKSRILQW